MPDTKGIFTVSLDFELYWGMLDKCSIAAYQKNLDGVDSSIRHTLDLFDYYGIHGTWATVGFLFASNVNELKVHFPDKIPGYLNNRLNPYHYIKNNGLESRYHFAPHIIEFIKKYPGQEIGTHTFSHFYCLEYGQTIEQFRADLQSAISIASRRNVNIRSLVFPRNELNNDYLPVLSEYGIDCYRGNMNGWLYKAVNGENRNIFRRAIRFADAYINLSGPNTYSLTDLAGVKPYNIPASCFLRPCNEHLGTVDELRKLRIKQALKYAAENNHLFHLWWHPHNFGAEISKNIDFLMDILSYYQELHELHGMQSLNMSEVTDILDSHIS